MISKQILVIAGCLMILVAAATASEHGGEVRFGEVPVPGAVVQAVQGNMTRRAMTDPQGKYQMTDLPDGMWIFQVEMPGFETARREIAVSKEGPPAQWDLKMKPLDSIQGETAPAGFPKFSEPLPILQTSAPEPETDNRLLINGSVSNGASTPFALARGFGNNRLRGRSLYTGTLAVSGSNSLFDARSFSLTGQDTPKPVYSRVQSSLTFGGPFQIPSLFRSGQFSVSYNRTQNRNATLQTAQVPTDAERRGDFSNRSAAIVDPTTGSAFSGNVIPDNRISSQARSLRDLFPRPNFTGVGRYNYQIPVVGETHADNISGVLNNIAITNADRLSATGSFQSSRDDNPDLFGFTDVTNTSSTSLGLALAHRITPRVTANVRYQFNRSVTETLPYFANRIDVSGIAGISGNDRDPWNWGPPGVTFASGMARLSNGTYAFDRSLSHSVSYTSNWIRGRHALGYGADYRRQQFNLLSQGAARGNFTFTGSASGYDFADFLLGLPTASSLALGNPDKYLRQSVYNAYLTDDWRVKAYLTLNLGVRWEYESPITELYGRLVNLQLAPNFVSATPVVAGNPDESLVQPDKSGVEPRIGLAWRPRAASSLVVRAGYGIYRDTSVYRAIADQMAQQSPLSKSLNVQSTPSNLLTLADGFRGSPSVTATTFAIDPDFRVGNAQNWQLSLQQDLPAAMQITVTYLGIKGTHVPQRILPNTFAVGASDPCAACPKGFVYMTSNGNTSRHSGTVELRRRQRNGFELSGRYTFAKAIDDAGLGGYHIVQNWQDRRSERGLSNFDQRHQLIVQGQYTTGMLAGIGTFWDGWRGKVLKEWTLLSQWTIGSGMPLTPVILAPVSGTGVTGSLRPDLTGAAVQLKSADGFLNPAAFAAPAPGTWGNAARNSITGPGQFALNASLTRTFRVRERVSMDLRIDATNVLNRVTFPTWNTTVNSSQFGLPTRANAMRTLQPSLRVRF